MEWRKLNDMWRRPSGSNYTTDENKWVDLSLKLGSFPGQYLHLTPPTPAPIPTPQHQQLLKCFSYTPMGIQMNMQEYCSNAVSQLGCPFPLPANQQLLNNQVAAPPVRNYTLIDVPARRGYRDHGSWTSGGGGGRLLEVQVPVQGVDSSYNDGDSAEPEEKRCTNLNCKTNYTPMWPKGPLGPETLCNACGIKYRKDEEKRRAKEAAIAPQNSFCPHPNYNP